MKKIIYPMLGFSAGIFACYFIWMIFMWMAEDVIVNTTLLFTVFLLVGFGTGFYGYQLAKTNFELNDNHKKLLYGFMFLVTVYLVWFFWTMSQYVFGGDM